MFGRLFKLLRVLRGDVLVLWFACRHPATPLPIKIGAVLMALYVLNPVDAITDLLPVAGWADDLALLALGVPWLLDRVPAQVRAEAEASARAAFGRWRMRAARR